MLFWKQFPKASLVLLCLLSTLSKLKQDFWVYAVVMRVRQWARKVGLQECSQQRDRLQNAGMDGT